MNKQKINSLQRKIFLITAQFFLFASCANAVDDADYIEYGDRMDLYSITYRWDGHSDGKKWAAQVSGGIDDHGLLNAKNPSDATEFCPKFKSLSTDQKRLFWIYLVSTIAELESSFQPSSSYTENFTDSSGTKVVSRGLLQLSLESAKDYNCPVAKGTDLYNSDTNLNCGVKILQHWIAEDGSIAGKSGGQWQGAGRYWSIFRHKLGKIQGWTKTIPFCK